MKLSSRSRTCFNPFDDPIVASGYEEWYSAAGKRADVEEKQVLRELLQDFRNARTLLEVGCGTGHFTRWFSSLGLKVVGLDVSRAMLAQAQQRQSPLSIQGDARALPFGPWSFDVVALITTLEFIHDPPAALTEATRVARMGVLLGVLNRWSFLALRHRLSRQALWRSARLFSPPELRRLIRQSVGDRLQGWRWAFALTPRPCVNRLSPVCAGFLGVAVHLANSSWPSMTAEASRSAH